MTPPKKNTILSNIQKDPYVIGIGASAGGLQALDRLFDNIPRDSVAYVIVQHLSPEHKSILTDILGRHTELTVKEAQHNAPVEVNNIYVIPADKKITLVQNKLQVTDKSPNNITLKTIDYFFKSLAQDKGARAVGIILSGTGTDGSEGVIAIKKAGGLVLVQDPETAKFDGMPRNAISTGSADFILPPELMPEEIFNFVKVKPIESQVTELITERDEPAFLQVLDLVHERTGIDFSNYKRPTIIRRISRRMAFSNTYQLNDYLDYLQLHPEEQEILSKEFLIGVTRFFRDQEAFDFLATTVLPELIGPKSLSDQLRIWVAGCSTGEEAYTIALLVREHLDAVHKEIEVKIFASDIDREALEYAGKGLYPASSLTDVSPDRLANFFVREEGKFRVTQRLRKMVIFAPHNVINDPPFSKTDLVSCRNMLIYLNPILQKKVINKFHYSLQVGGYLFLGPSESIGERNNFLEVNKKWKIFQNTLPANSLGLEHFSNAGLIRNSPPAAPLAGPRGLNPKQVAQHIFSELLNEAILEEYGFAAIYIDENYDVLHGLGQFRKYMTLPDHTFTINLLKLVSSDLALSLGTLLRKASRDKEKVAAPGVQVREDGQIRHINILVKPFFNEKKLYQRSLLVILQEEQPHTLPELSQEVFWSDTHNEERVRDLELELQHTKDDLQAVVEELETSNEELQSTNEELLSSNEELQSTNEELQSLNEELQTINSEHQYKIRALMELDDDLNNYFRSTNIGQTFVDRQLVIRKFTPSASRQINLIESDIGRPLDQISHNLRYEGLIDDIRQVIKSNITIEKQVQDRNDIWYQMRLLPYVTQERRIDGAIIIFNEINELKELQLLQASIMDLSPNAILSLKAIRNHAGVITNFEWTNLNKMAASLTGHRPEQLIGKAVSKTVPKLLDTGLFDLYVRVVEAQEQLDLELELTLCPDQEPQWYHIVGRKMEDGLVLTLLNMTERKRYEQTLQQQQQEIRANAEQFKMLLEALPHITWTSQPGTLALSYNQKWYDYTGLRPQDSQEGDWKRVLYPEDLEKMQVFFQQTKTPKAEGIYTTEVRLRRHDGQYRWHLVRAVPIFNEAGDLRMWIGSATDIQDQKEAEVANMRLHLQQQKEILNAVLKTQEAERVRISEALHNSLGQILYATRLNVEEVPQDNGSQKVVHDKTLELLNQAIATTRNISFELSPSILKDFGMKTALEELIQRVQGGKIHIDCDIEGFEERPDYLVELSLYRIIQELINNILKHAEATQAFIELSKDANQILLKVKDNGKGFDYKKLEKHKGLGLSSIRNRTELLDGSMKIDSQPGKGTQVTITVKQKD